MILYSFILSTVQHNLVTVKGSQTNQIEKSKSFQILSNPFNLCAYQPQTYPQSCHAELVEASHNPIRKSQFVNLSNPSNLCTYHHHPLPQFCHFYLRRNLIIQFVNRTSQIVHPKSLILSSLFSLPLHYRQ